jgi:hypothetical protein
MREIICHPVLFQSVSAIYYSDRPYRTDALSWILVGEISALIFAARQYELKQDIGGGFQFQEHRKRGLNL